MLLILPPVLYSVKRFARSEFSRPRQAGKAADIGDEKSRKRSQVPENTSSVWLFELPMTERCVHECENNFAFLSATVAEKRILNFQHFITTMCKIQG